MSSQDYDMARALRAVLAMDPQRRARIASALDGTASITTDPQDRAAMQSVAALLRSMGEP